VEKVSLKLYSSWGNKMTNQNVGAIPNKKIGGRG
jgi:hypothetical protein